MRGFRAAIREHVKCMHPHLHSALLAFARCRILINHHSSSCTHSSFTMHKSLSGTAPKIAAKSLETQGPLESGHLPPAISNQGMQRL